MHSLIKLGTISEKSTTVHLWTNAQGRNGYLVITVRK